jgi:hypothetical protein
VLLHSGRRDAAENITCIFSRDRPSDCSSFTCKPSHLTHRDSTPGSSSHLSLCHDAVRIFQSTQRSDTTQTWVCHRDQVTIDPHRNPTTSRTATVATYGEMTIIHSCNIVPSQNRRSSVRLCSIVKSQVSFSMIPTYTHALGTRQRRP